MTARSTFARLAAALSAGVALSAAVFISSNARVPFRPSAAA